MNRLRRHRLSARALGELEAIDATLDGAPVPAEHARLAALVRELRALRATPQQGFVDTLDASVAHGFAGDAARRSGRSQRRRRPANGAPLRRHARVSRPAIAVALAVALTAAVAVPFALSGGGRHPEAASPAAGKAQSGAAMSAAPAERGPLRAQELTPAPGSTSASTATSSASTATSSASTATSSAASSGARQVERASTLDLGVPPNAIESTSHRVFTLVNGVGGYVRQSNVSSGGPGQGGASFDVRIPSSNLSRAMAELAQLGHVRSENDTTNDVTERFNSIQGSLGNLQAERAGLLKRLAAASEPQQEAALKAQLQSVEQRISQVQGSLSALRARIDYTTVTLTLTAEAPVATKQGGLTPGAAARQAGQILEAALAVVVIALATLVPLAVITVGGWLLIGSTRRRLREQALDAN